MAVAPLTNLTSGNRMRGIPAYIVLVVLCIHMRSEDANAQPLNDSTLINSTYFRENLHLFTDRSLYSAGEPVFFRIYNLSNKLLKEFDWSRVVYLELMNGANRPVAQGKYHLDSGGSQGEIFIPDTLSSGLYYIRIYTRWMQNFPASTYYHLPLVIVNPGKINTIDLSAVGSEKESMAINNNRAGGIVCTPDKFEYGKREKVTVRLNMGNSPPSKDGYCISVIRKGYLDEDFNYTPGSGDTKSIRLKDPLYYPETRGISIAGVLVRQQDRQPAGSSIMGMTLLGSDPDFIEFGSDEKGRISLSIPHHLGNVDALITFYDNKEENREIQLDSEFSSEYADAAPSSLEFLRDRRDQVEDALVTTQLRKAFERTARDSTITNEGDTAYTFYGEPDFRYLSRDYVELPNLEEFFINIIPQVEVRKERGRISLEVLDNSKYILPYPPLILLDNVPVLEAENLLSVSPGRIEYIDVINRVYIRGSYNYGGIISIRSREGDRAGVRLPEGSIFINFDAFYPLKEPVFPDYEFIDKADRTPDLRTTLYWSAQQDITSGEGNSITFYTSDRSGEYEVIVRGISAGGSMVRGHCEFSVK
jgi:hypothetical protein